MFDAKKILSGLGVEPSEQYTAEQLACMSDHDLEKLRFVDLDDTETELVMKEMEKRGN